MEQITGLNRRTIHYYIQERVIPPPEGAGGTARYSEEHVLHLILVKHMQQSHLKPSGIKEALAGLSLDEMRDLSKAAKNDLRTNGTEKRLGIGLLRNPRKQ